MPGMQLCVMITPSAAGLAWREALSAEAGRRGWPIVEAKPGHPVRQADGLVFVHEHTAMAAVAPGRCMVLVDTTATGTAEPGLPATPEELTVRSHALVEAEIAVRNGALFLNAARYRLDLPGLGPVERTEGEAYRIHPAVASSPLALFDQLPVPAGASADWHPRWFAYPAGVSGSADSPVIDMTGRMRALVYGPYFRLPAGRWRVDVRFSVDPERAHAPILFEWGSGTEYCRIMTTVRHPGQYSVQLDRVWAEPGAAQLRIWNGHPVFEGRLEFQGCRVTRVRDDDPSPPTPTDRIVEAAVA